MAAGLVHAVTLFCSHGNMTECVCAGRGRGRGLGEGRWDWGGCSEHVRFGTWFSRRLMDGGGNASGSDGGFTLALMNQHNSEVGRQVSPAPQRRDSPGPALNLSSRPQAVHRLMASHCRCHGVSGSCAVKTCWRTMASFQQVGVDLKERYERSVHVRRRARKDRPRLPDKHQLVFINKSPNYCVENRRRGVLGTRGRRCSRGSGGAGGCSLLCCGRGYNTHVVRHVQRCHCKFVWCCYVRCRRCESMNDTHTCK